MPNKAKRMMTSYPGVYYIVSKAPDGRPERIFYIFYRKDGKQIEEKAGRQFKDKMTAAKANQIRTRRIEGDPNNKERREAAKKVKWTISRLWHDYISDKRPGKGLTTDKSRFRKFLELGLGKKEPQDILPLDVERLRQNMKKKNYAPQTVKHVLSLLKRIINHGARLGICPGLKFRLPTLKVNNLKTEDLSPEQLEVFMGAINEEFDCMAANFLRLALCTGMRRGELFKLKWKDVDFNKGFINIRGPKGGKDQSIPLNQLAREVLENHPRISDFVFPGRGGRQRSRPPKRIEAIRERAGLPPDFRPLHGLRHVYASMLASSGQVDLYTLQKLLTHKSPAMTQRYAHLRDAALRQASDLAGGLLGQVFRSGQKREISTSQED